MQNNILFEPPHNGTATSRAAAISVRRTVARDRDLIIAALGRHGSHGATCDELERELDLSHQTTSARLRGMAITALIVSSGNETRPTRTGRPAIVWRLREVR